MHRIKSRKLCKGLWLLYEEWGAVKQCHRVYLLFSDDEETVRISVSFAEQLIEVTRHGQ